MDLEGVGEVQGVRGKGNVNATKRKGMADWGICLVLAGSFFFFFFSVFFSLVKKVRFGSVLSL